MAEIYTFFGADSKVGVTMTAQSLAMALAELKSNDKIILLNIDGDDGQTFTKSDKPGFNAIKQSLLNNLTTIREVLDSCDNEDNLWTLSGFSDMLSISQFEPAHFAYLISLLENEFDYILIDAGSNLNSGLTVGALDASPYISETTAKNILVTTQQASALKKFQKVDSNILKKAKFSFDELIINKYNNSRFLPVIQTVTRNYGFEKAYALPYIGQGADWLAEIDKKPLFVTDKKRYRKEALNVAEFLFSNATKEKSEG